MGRVVYSMGVSLDGFIAGPGGEVAVRPPDEELHRFHNEQARELGAHMLGRRLYEVMSYWDTFEEQNPSAPEHALEFARIWTQLPKVVFSTTLDRVSENATLKSDGVADEAARLKREAGGDVAVGGAGLASTLIELDLIDEYRIFFDTVVAGGGTAYLPPLERRIPLRLLETRTFDCGVVYMRCERARGAAQ